MSTTPGATWKIYPTSCGIWNRYRWISRTRSHWVARAPFGRTVFWDAEIVEDQPNALLSWQAVGATAVPNKGSVRFSEAPAGHGTVVAVSLRYSPPAGMLVLRGSRVRNQVSRLRAICTASVRCLRQVRRHPPRVRPPVERSAIGSLANRCGCGRDEGCLLERAEGRAGRDAFLIRRSSIRATRSSRSPPPRSAVRTCICDGYHPHHGARRYSGPRVHGRGGRGRSAR